MPVQDRSRMHAGEPSPADSDGDGHFRFASILRGAHCPRSPRKNRTAISGRAPQPIPINVVVNGTADNEDVDYFVVEAKKGDRISAEVEGIRLGITLFDAYVAIMSCPPASNCLRATTTHGLRLAGRRGVDRRASEDGKYIIQVRESSYAGNGACLYRLHVGSFPRPVALLPAEEAGMAKRSPSSSLAMCWVIARPRSRCRRNAFPRSQCLPMRTRE